MDTQTITLGGGCFWCLEAVYKRFEGIIDVTSGYAGGTVSNPTYEEVCAGRTGHAEVVRLTFDAARTDLAAILRRFFAAHDPTTRDRQGNDIGTQYRSIILCESEDQVAVATAIRDEANAERNGRVVTEIVMLEAFYEAEEYHQDYFDKHPNVGYCRLVIAPKLTKLGIRAIPI